MVIRHALGRFEEVDISGHDAEWAALALALGRDGAEMECDLDADPAPYDRCVAKLRVKHAPGVKVRFAMGSDGALSVEGDPGLIEILAANAASFGAEWQAGDHIHIDYVSDDHYVARDTISVVFMHQGNG